jgi:UDP-N-acetylmuramoyl-tripeptide--D-alanyl-D-alanine ligase
VVTAVSHTHLEKFAAVEEIELEKGRLVEALPKDGVAILNHDDERVWKMRDRTKARVISYGFDQDADVKVVPDTLSYAFDPDSSECGMRFKVVAEGSTVPMFMPGVLGRQAAYAGLAGIAVGLAKGMNLIDIAEGLRHYKPLPGRVRCLAGIKRSVLVDDSYNASPRSVRAALQLLRDLPIAENAKRIVVLGDMLELGPVSERKHRDIGKIAAELGLDMLVLVGERVHDTESAAVAAGLDEDRIFHFAMPGEAGRFVQERMNPGDIVLIKGSRGMRMETVTKELMADPLRAEQLLVSVPEEDEAK